MICASVVVLISVCVGPFWYTLKTLGMFSPPPPLSDAGCIHLAGPVGAEDGVFLPEFGAVILSELDDLAIEFTKVDSGGGPRNTPKGSLWLLDQVNSSSPRLMRLESPLPPGVGFHSHGLGLHGDVLFVINHAYHEGGERVERFRIERTSKTSDLPVRLVHLGSVLGHDGDLAGAGKWSFTTRLNGIMNDVAPIGEHEFFVTQYHDHPRVMDGDFESEGIVDIMKKVIFPSQHVCRIYHCACANHASDGSCSQTSCSPVGPPAGSWNGISTSPDKRLLYVNDIFRRLIFEFRIESTKGGVTLVEQRSFHVDLPALVDNIDATSGVIWGGVNGIDVGMKLPEITKKVKSGYDAAVAAGTPPPRPHTHIRPTPDAPPSVATGGGAFKIDLSSGEMTPVITTQMMFMTSFAGVLGDKVILGSPCDEGVLVCPKPKK